MSEQIPNSNEQTEKLANLFKEGFDAVFPAEKKYILDEQKCKSLWELHKTLDNGRIKAIWSKEEKSIIAFLYQSNNPSFPTMACSISRTAHDQEKCTGLEHDLHFARCYSKILNEDLNQSLINDVANRERYSILTDSRFARAISRFLPPKSHLSYRLIQIMEQSSFLRYENNHVRHWLVLSRKHERIAKKLEQVGAGLVEFSQRIPVAQAVLKEKWIRSVIDHRRAILLVKPEGDGQVVGLFSLPDQPLDEKQPAFAPHESLVSLQSLLCSNDVIMGMSANGDLYTLEGNGIIFKRSQGQWRYINYPYFFINYPYISLLELHCLWCGQP